MWSTEFPAILSALLTSQKRNFGAAMAVSGVLGGLGVFMPVSAIGLPVSWLGEHRMWLAMLIPASGFVLVGLGGLDWILRHTGREASDAQKGS